MKEFLVFLACLLLLAAMFILMFMAHVQEVTGR